jgi:hypothetical protein
MFSAFVFLYILAATLFYAHMIRRAAKQEEPVMVRTHPPVDPQVYELYPELADERKAA